MQMFHAWRLADLNAFQLMAAMLLNRSFDWCTFCMRDVHVGLHVGLLTW